MKVAVIGNGHVGATVFRELQAFREIHELVLVGRNAEACRAEAEDYLDAMPLRIDRPGEINGGGFELCEGADILVYCAGPSIQKGQSDRNLILNKNIEVMKVVFDQVDKYAKDAVVIVVSNPLDVITSAIIKYTGRPESKVIGTGCLLDTARLVKIISWIFKVSVNDVSGFVLGEHGNSSVAILSHLYIMNMHYTDYLRDCCNGILPIDGEQLTDEVRQRGFEIFKGKGFTSAGVAAAAARIVFDIVNDVNEIVPVSTMLHGQYGIDGIAISVPCQIGKNGISSIKVINMNEAEREKLLQSAAIIKENYDLIQW